MIIMTNENFCIGFYNTQDKVIMNLNGEEKHIPTNKAILLNRELTDALFNIGEYKLKNKK